MSSWFRWTSEVSRASFAPTAWLASPSTTSLHFRDTRPSRWLRLSRRPVGRLGLPPSLGLSTFGSAWASASSRGWVQFLRLSTDMPRAALRPLDSPFRVHRREIGFRFQASGVSCPDATPWMEHEARPSSSRTLIFGPTLPSVRRLPPSWSRTTLTAFSTPGLQACCILLPVLRFATFGRSVLASASFRSWRWFRSASPQRRTLQSLPLAGSLPRVTAVVAFLSLPLVGCPSFASGSVASPWAPELSPTLVDSKALLHQRVRCVHRAFPLDSRPMLSWASSLLFLAVLALAGPSGAVSSELCQRQRTIRVSSRLTPGCVQIGRGRVGKECRSRWSPYH